MRPIPIDTNDFPMLCQLGQLYVDKTRYLHQLITDPNCRSFFISRPRRFGKSLMVSTLKAIFRGQRKLFNGLDISKTDYNWTQHPVIHLNFGFCARENYMSFLPAFAVEIKRALDEAGYAYNSELPPIANFSQAIDFFYNRGNLPVILIDEYDDPVARTIKDAHTAEEVREQLAAFYGQLKDRSGRFRFLLITGISKFTKMSIFSALSSLQDISFDDRYAAMLGFTEGELDTYYGEYMTAHATRMKLDMGAYRTGLKRMYNGYRFWKYKGESVYNPVSINLTMAEAAPVFDYYWTDTGRPSMLMNFLKREDVLAIDPDKDIHAADSDFDVTELAHIGLVGLLYQTGYLTIKDYNPFTRLFSLQVPDEEVRKDLAILLASLCAKNSVTWATSVGSNLLLENWDAFFQGLKALYAGVAYGPKETRVCEYSYARCLSFLLQGRGINCQPEVVQANGRAVMVCTHHCGIYIFELKVDQPADIAMDQMQRKNYAMPYIAAPRPIWLIGLAFDSKTRLLANTAVEAYRKANQWQFSSNVNL